MLCCAPKALAQSSEPLVLAVTPSPSSGSLRSRSQPKAESPSTRWSAPLYLRRVRLHPSVSAMPSEALVPPAPLVRSARGASVLRFCPSCQVGEMARKVELCARSPRSCARLARSRGPKEFPTGGAGPPARQGCAGSSRKSDSRKLAARGSDPRIVACIATEVKLVLISNALQ